MRIRPQFADALIAVALTGASAVLGQESGSQGWDPLDAWGYLLVVLAGLPLAFRVRAPLAVLLKTGVAKRRSSPRCQWRPVG
uniref:Uncharacterized protein n=1 Tax=Streptomyces sp. NBC_00003 TaxID=2903608 RepID=A0AAU2V560_9ACTN